VGRAAGVRAAGQPAAEGSGLGVGACEPSWSLPLQEDPPPRCPTGTQFAVPADDLYGYGDLPPVLVTDLLRVPAGLQGDFVLSWRWDCEQTDQVWSTCGAHAPHRPLSPHARPDRLTPSATLSHPLSTPSAEQPTSPSWPDLQLRHLCPVLHRCHT